MEPICAEVKQWVQAASAEELLAFFDRLCDCYLQADSLQRADIRQAVAENPRIQQSLLYDSLSGIGPGAYLIEAARRAETDKDFTRYLRCALLTMALTDGFGDWRDTIMWLGALRQEAKSRGIDARPHFEEIAATADGNNLHGISEMSTRDLFLAGARG